MNEMGGGKAVSFHADGAGQESNTPSKEELT